MKKKVFFIAVLIVLLLSVCACKNDKNSDGDSTDAGKTEAVSQSETDSAGESSIASDTSAETSEDTSADTASGDESSGDLGWSKPY